MGPCLLLLLLWPSVVSALAVTFPSPAGYWVTNATNILKWSRNTTDPENFSVELLNTNQSSLNGNFQVGNALSTANGTAQIVLVAVPPGTYTLQLVNSSHYEWRHEQVYYTSASFEVKPSGTQMIDPSAVGGDPTMAAAPSALPSTSSSVLESSKASGIAETATTSPSGIAGATAPDSTSTSDAAVESSFARQTALREDSVIAVIAFACLLGLLRG